MSDATNAQLLELTRLWVEASPRSLARIPDLCGAIEALAAARGTGAGIDTGLLRRLELLSARAESRISGCLAIQMRTGSYSRGGILEQASTIATSGWEG